jgi:hypothetical protein
MSTDVDAPCRFQAKSRLAHEAYELSGRTSDVEQRLLTEFCRVYSQIGERECLVALIAVIAAIGEIDRAFGFGGWVARVELIDLMFVRIGIMPEAAAGRASNTERRLFSRRL